MSSFRSLFVRVEDGNHSFSGSVIGMDIAVLKNIKIIIFESMNILKSDHVSVYKPTLGQGWPAK